MSKLLEKKEIDLTDTLPMVVCQKSESTDQLDYVWLRPARKGEIAVFYKEK